MAGGLTRRGFVLLALAGCTRIQHDTLPPTRGAPVPPLNLVGDYGGGALYLAFGVMAALFERQRSGRGQVVDAAMVDGAASLASIFHGLRAGGLWGGGRGENLLDGGAGVLGPHPLTVAGDADRLQGVPGRIGGPDDVLGRHTGHVVLGGLAAEEHHEADSPGRGSLAGHLGHGTTGGCA